MKVVKVRFLDELYQVVLTDHAEARMKARDVSVGDVKKILETGTVKNKEKENYFWVYKKLSGRRDNLVCLSVVLENPFLVVVTALVHWRPK